MCLSRREVLLVGAAGMAGALLPGKPAAATTFATTRFGNVDVIPRATWGPNLPVKGNLAPETVKFLLVHHSASPNGYAEGDVIRYLSSFHALHTGPTKGWPDIAYNFFVDRFGRIFEGRTGSLKGPVMGDATGGNQGFSQLICLVGDHSKEPPTAAALTSLSALLASIAARDRVSLAEGATVSFTSRGSNKHPKGVTVTTPTIAGHRDMSLTECPGDACYPLVGTKITAAARQAGGAAAVAPPATEAAAPTGPETTLGAPASVTETETQAAPTTQPKAQDPDIQLALPGAGQSQRSSRRLLWPLAGAGGVTVAGAGLLLRRRMLHQRAEAASFSVRATEPEPPSASTGS